MRPLVLLPDQLSICQLPSGAQVDIDAPFLSITWTAEEVSVVCPSNAVPAGVLHRSDGWRCIRFDGPLDLSLTGVLSSVLQPLSAAQISVFTIATYNTDYLLVPAHELERAIAAMRRAGITVRD